MFDIGKPETVAQWVEQTTHYQKYNKTSFLVQIKFITEDSK